MFGPEVAPKRRCAVGRTVVALPRRGLTIWQCGHENWHRICHGGLSTYRINAAACWTSFWIRDAIPNEPDTLPTRFATE